MLDHSVCPLTVQNDDDHHGQCEEGVLPVVRVDGHQDRGDDEEDDDDGQRHHQLQLLVYPADNTNDIVMSTTVPKIT